MEGMEARADSRLCTRPAVIDPRFGSLLIKRSTGGCRYLRLSRSKKL